ncbi:MAG: FtsX-like permease family protein [Bacteroidota bacterium]
MNFEFFISKRIASKSNRNGVSHPIIRIAIGGIALGIAVMIISVAIVTGFKKAISEKVVGFAAHIQVTNYDDNVSLETLPISRNQPFYASLQFMKGIRHIQVFATKGGIIKTKDDIYGAIMKGIGSDYDWSFFEKKMVEGKTFRVSDTGKTNEILVSRLIAKKLKLKCGDDLAMYFIQDPPRVRKFKICGIYKSGLEDFDKSYIITDIAHIQKLNDWKQSQIGGFEIFLNDFNDLDKIFPKVYSEVGFQLNARSVKEIYPQIFDWLNLQDMNVQIIIILMILVACINMISALLIIILERTSMIGVLKAIGATNGSVRRIFINHAVLLIGKGMILGNILGIGLCLLQYYTGIISLPQESYYVSSVPINLNALHIILINAGTLVVCTLMMILPTYIITRITPVRAIRFQ